MSEVFTERSDPCVCLLRRGALRLWDIPSGTYALVVLDDGNMNGKLDIGWIRIAKEGHARQRK
jgi:uncharacterized protein (DUF2141 family)